LALSVIGLNNCRCLFIREVNIFLESYCHTCLTFGAARNTIATSAQAALTWAACSDMCSGGCSGICMKFLWFFLNDQKLSVRSITTSCFKCCFKFISYDSNRIITMILTLENNGSRSIIIHLELEWECVISLSQISG